MDITTLLEIAAALVSLAAALVTALLSIIVTAVTGLLAVATAAVVFVRTFRDGGSGRSR